MIHFPLITQIHNFLSHSSLAISLTALLGSYTEMPTEAAVGSGRRQGKWASRSSYKTRENGCGELTFKHTHTRTLTYGLTSDLFWNPWPVANKGTKPVDSIFQIFLESISSLLPPLGHCDHFCFLPNSTFVLSLFSALHVYLLVSLESRSESKSHVFLCQIVLCILRRHDQRE